MEISSKRYSIIIVLILLIIPNLIFAQSHCDTLFHISGDTTLISPKHSIFKNVLKYSECGGEFNMKRINKKEILKLRKNSNITSSFKKNSDRFNTKIIFLNKSEVKGKLAGLKDSTISIIVKETKLLQFDSQNIDVIKITNKRKVKRATILGGVLGGTIGSIIASMKTNNNEEHFLPKGFKNQVLFIPTGILVGSIVGAGIGNKYITLKVKGDSNKLKFEKDKLKFKY